jgi:hypothetical protein
MGQRPIDHFSDILTHLRKRKRLKVQGSQARGESPRSITTPRPPLLLFLGVAIGIKFCRHRHEPGTR